MFNKYPYTDFHELNLDWIIAQIKELHRSYDDFKAVNTITNAGAWDITKQYQSWTIVSDHNAGYISLRPVPAGIDISNIEYWGLVADYDILITNLSQRIGVLEGQMTTLNNTTIPGINNNISALDAKYDPLLNKKYVFLGDSYNFSGGGWLSAVVEALGITDYYDYVVSGHGFTTGATWLDDITDFVTAHPDAAPNITDIVIVGGVNDASTTSLGSLENAINTFCTYVKSNLPKATITMCYVGNAQATSSVLDTRNYKNRMSCILIEQRVLSNNGHVFAPGCINALFQHTLFNADGLHPNNYGQIFGIIPAVCLALKGSEFNPTYVWTSGSYPYNGVEEYVANGFEVLKIGTTQISAGITIDTTWRAVYDIPSQVSASEHSAVYTTVELRDGSGSVRHNVFARVHGRKLELMSADTLTSSSYDTFTTNSKTYILGVTFSDDIQGST